MTEIVMLDQRIIEMIHEVRAHPALHERYLKAEEEGNKAHSTIFTGQAGDPDIEVIRTFDQAIGFLAAEVGILLDGIYNYESICNLCNEIRLRLVERRSVIIH